VLVCVSRRKMVCVGGQCMWWRERKRKWERERSLDMSLSRQNMWPICIDLWSWKHAVMKTCVRFSQVRVKASKSEQSSFIAYLFLAIVHCVSFCYWSCFHVSNWVSDIFSLLYGSYCWWMTGWPDSICVPLLCQNKSTSPTLATISLPVATETTLAISVLHVCTFI